MSTLSDTTELSWVDDFFNIDRTLVVAEIGINHEGSLSRAFDLVLAAKEAGADAVKFQTIDPDEAYVKTSLSYEMFKRAQLSQDETQLLFEVAREKHIAPFTTVADVRTLAWVEALAPFAYKVSSGLLNHTPVVQAIARLGRPMMLSTGMAFMDEIQEAVSICKKEGNEKLIVQQCTSEHPCQPKNANIRAIQTLKSTLDVQVGFSDHTLGHLASIAAVAAGARVIEKHFTLDTKREGFDHMIALDPRGFADMVGEIREVEVLLGNGQKAPSDVEDTHRRLYRRVLVARRPIPAGEILSADDIACKRPDGTQTSGIEPKFLETVIGKRATTAIDIDQPLKKSELTA